MRKSNLVSLACVLVSTATALGLMAAAGASTTTTGNGAPSGAHYDLNIIGVPHAKTASMTGTSGHVIFVDLGSTNKTVTSKILLSQSTDGTFQVLDANATGGSTGSFELPAPGTYAVWGRPVGTPGGSATMTTCATDLSGGTTPVCSINSAVFVRGNGKSQFKDVTAALTTIVVTTAPIGCSGTTISLFDPCLQGYFWKYDNNGLKVLQLRFYFNS
jgi:hypothetical protein